MIYGINIQKVLDVMQFMCHDKGRWQEMSAGLYARAAPCPLPELTLKRNVLDGLQGLYGKNVVLYPFWVGKWR